MKLNVGDKGSNVSKIISSYFLLFHSFWPCPKSKVTILIFNNFLMKEVVSMKFSGYLVMILKFCLKPTNLLNFLYLDNGDY